MTSLPCLFSLILSKGSAHELEHLFCFFVGVSSGYEHDVHTTDLLNLIVLDFREDKLLLKTKSIVTSAIETVGVKVTLRGDKMYEFLDRLFSIALPRVRDFRGINPNSFDGRGNYAFGLKEQLIFPEIEYDKVDKIRGMNICICTTAQTDEEAKELLTQLGAPFQA